MTKTTPAYMREEKDAPLSTVEKLKAVEAVKKSKVFKHLLDLGGEYTSSKVQASNGTIQLTYAGRLKNGKPEVYQATLTGYMRKMPNAVSYGTNKQPSAQKLTLVAELETFTADDDLVEQATARLEMLLVSLKKYLSKTKVTESSVQHPQLHEYFKSLSEVKLDESATDDVWERLLKFKEFVDAETACKITPNDEKQFKQDIELKLAKGWTKDEIYAYYKWAEEFDDCSHTEDQCLAKMSEITKKVNARLAALKEGVSAQVNEGFWDWSVMGSDSASDLHYECKKAKTADKIADVLEKAFDYTPISAYNTPGWANVAMVISEKYMKLAKTNKRLQAIADKAVKHIETKVLAGSKNKDAEMIAACEMWVKNLKTLHESKETCKEANILTKYYKLNESMTSTEAFIKSFSVANLKMPELMAAYNGLYTISSRDRKLFKSSEYMGYKNGHHAYAVVMLEDEQEIDGEAKYYISFWYISFDSEGFIVADPSGNIEGFETQESAEAEVAKRYKKK